MPDITANPDRSAGNAPLELVILAPILLLLISLVFAAGRTSVAQGSVYAAARDAARQASISRSPAQALSEARSGALSELAQQKLRCAPATVKVTVSCQVRLADLLLPGIPGTKTLVAKFSSPLDLYRGR